MNKQEKAWFELRMLSEGHALPTSPNSVFIDHYTPVLRHLPHCEFDHVLQAVNLCSQSDTVKQGAMARPARHGDLLCFFTAQSAKGAAFLICSPTKAKAFQISGLVVLTNPEMALAAVKLPFKIEKQDANSDV